jgi:hypothetical protein
LPTVVVAADAVGNASASAHLFDRENGSAGRGCLSRVRKCAPYGEIEQVAFRLSPATFINRSAVRRGQRRHGQPVCHGSLAQEISTNIGTPDKATAERDFSGRRPYFGDTHTHGVELFPTSPQASPVLNGQNFATEKINSACFLKQEAHAGSWTI